MGDVGGMGCGRSVAASTVDLLRFAVDPRTGLIEILFLFGEGYSLGWMTAFTDIGACQVLTIFESGQVVRVMAGATVVKNICMVESRSHERVRCEMAE